MMTGLLSQLSQKQRKEILNIAGEFVNAVFSYTSLEPITGLTDEHSQVFLKTVKAAGFEVAAIAPGILQRGIREGKDGTIVGHESINNFCRYKALTQAKFEDYYFATGWLDCAVRRVILGAVKKKESPEQIIETIADEIERSIPLEPIKLTPENDFLRENPPRLSRYFDGFEYFIDHPRDWSEINAFPGIHDYCGTRLEIKETSKTHNCLICKACFLRLPFPNKIKTYGQLRKHFAHCF